MLNQKHQLAAIMFTDIAGYTALMSSNESRAMEILARNRELHNRYLSKYNGRLLKEIGDGMLTSFDSVSSAIKCAIDLIKATSDDPLYNLSIGIHLGEVIFSENDAFGEGVNIASRIEALATPNSILISQKVLEEVQNHENIKVKSLGMFQLKNDRKEREIFVVINEGLYVPTLTEIKINYGKKRKNPVKTKYLIPGIIAIIIIISIVIFIRQESIKEEKSWAQTEALPQIQNYLDEFVFPGESVNSWKIYDMAKRSQHILGTNPVLENFFDSRMYPIHIFTDPPGAKIYFNPYQQDTSWRFSGNSPLVVDLPSGFSLIRIEKENYSTLTDIVWQAGPTFDTLNYKLSTDVPAGMVFIPGSAVEYKFKAGPATLRLVGLEEAPAVNLGDFYMDRFEVTNKQFKNFVDNNGYGEPRFWKYKFMDNGAEIPFNDAISRFTDKTGLPGPSTWEGGSYMAGQENYPVSGISWYEAVAYAEFMKKSLPTAYHWDRAALTWGSSEIVKTANLQSNALKAVGISMNRFGVYDLAGNVREWCFNLTRDNQRFILGGGWDDYFYAFNDAYAQPPFDRSSTNGFRCIKIIDNAISKISSSPLEVPKRDFLSEQIVSDDIFESYLSQYKYDNSNLDVMVLDTAETEEWKMEYVEYNAAYGNERMGAFIYTPRNGKPPYQTILIFPGSGAIHSNTSKGINPNNFNFIINSGRAWVLPILKSTYERQDELNSDYPNTSVFWKDHVIMWVKDFSRTIDYLETRDDIDVDKIAYYGISWGGAMGSIVPAVEKRLKVNILIVAGLNMQKSLPEVDQIQYLPRISNPTLMLNGKYDFFFPYESSQKPFFTLLGTPEKDKKLIISEGSHSYPRIGMIKEVLSWLDNYFGPQNLERQGMINE